MYSGFVYIFKLVMICQSRKHKNGTTFICHYQFSIYLFLFLVGRLLETKETSKIFKQFKKKCQSLYSMTNYPMKYNNQVWNYQVLKKFTVLPQFPYNTTKILRPIFFKYHYSKFYFYSSSRTKKLAAEKFN